MLNGCLRNINGILMISHGENRHTLLLTIHLQLFDGCRSVYITGYQQRLASLCFQLACNLRRSGRLTCTL